MAEPSGFYINFEPTVAHINYFSEANINRLDEHSKIERFKGMDPMIQRFSVADHTIRVSCLSSVAAETLDMLGVPIDVGVTMWDGDIHDEPERGTGDVITPVKRAMSTEEREKFDEWEMEIMRGLEDTLDKPTWATSAASMYENYRKKDTIEARVVNFFDKWDASNEVVHELVCGSGNPEFLPILENYRGMIAELREQNADWLPLYERVFGKDAFTVPEAESLNKKSVDDLKFTSVADFLKSICNDNPDSYGLWLTMNTYFWGISFLNRTFPGWVDKMPPKIIEAANMYADGERWYKAPSGLVIVTDENKKVMDFARSMGIRSIDGLFEFIDARV